MARPLDVLFVNADSAAAAYQALAKDFGVALIDAPAERLTHEQTVARIAAAAPRLVCFVVYGQNPNSGTTNMIGNTACCRLLKDTHPEMRTCFVGSHTSALPREVIALPYVDFILLNEGVYALHNLLRSDLATQLEKIKGIGYKIDGVATLNTPERVVPNDRMDIDLPGYAWDLLPYREKPLDLYRAHFWHAEFNHEKRTPFASLYTSLGCKFKCDFCMVNIVNRASNDEGTVSANSPGMRFWSPAFILKEFEKLAGYGVESIRISDEMFFLNKNYFEPLIDGLIERDLGLRMWAYSRVDTVRQQYLEKFRKAGIGWLALGVEAANQSIRREVSKGSFEEINIREVVGTVRASGINVIANYIFGFPDDTHETMQQTLDLALELNTETANMYPCQALPGSPLHRTAIANGWKMPDDYAGYAFLSYGSQPLPTKHLSAAEVLRFRDQAWHKYFTNPAYLDLVETKFGLPQRRNVEEMSRIQLKRKLLEA
jgi:radical SAM superfamily enzyme YgiQ (UPF0313 family)